MGIAVPFPEALPTGYQWLEDEPSFDPARHLALETPAETIMLSDLGYQEAEIANKATPVAASLPFRLLSAEGTETMLSVARRLRVTMVDGYVAMDPSLDDQSRTADLIAVDDHECLWSEWAKFAAWRSHGRLAKLLEELEFNPDRELVATRLEEAIADAQQAAMEMRADKRQMHHYGG